MADKGNPVITFGATTLGSTDCLQSVTLDYSADDLTYQCDGATKHIAGDKSGTLSFTFALSANDVTKLTAFEPGSTGTLDYYPAGNVSGNIKYSASNATVISAPFGEVVNSVMTVDVTIALDDITISAVV